jgi:hypothetical protein
VTSCLERRTTGRVRLYSQVSSAPYDRTVLSFLHPSSIIAVYTVYLVSLYSFSIIAAFSSLYCMCVRLRSKIDTSGSRAVSKLKFWLFAFSRAGYTD